METKRFSLFILLYIIMVALFLGLILIIYFGANRLFKAALNDEIKDRAKVMVKILSLLMGAFLFVF